MSLLHDVIEFPALSRMTGIWMNTMRDPDRGDEVVQAQLIVLPRDQDPDVESDFLCSHLPFSVGGFHGVFPDGGGWLVVLQMAPASASTGLMSGARPSWALEHAIDRALRFNEGAEAQDRAEWQRGDMEDYYRESGITDDAVAAWSAAELVWGLLAECCNVSLGDIVEGYSAGCAFPGAGHECSGQVFDDVFAQWTTGALNGPEPDLEEVFEPPEGGEPGQGFTGWKRKKLMRFKRRELLELASAAGWDSRDLGDLPKKELVQRMVDGQRTTPRESRALGDVEGSA